MLRPSNLRALLGRHPAVALLLVVLLLIAAVIFAAYRFAHSNVQEAPKAYFVNDQTLAPEIHSTFQVPPIATPKGELVYGVYMACGDCAHKQLAYLQKFSPEGKQALDQFIRQHGAMPSPLDFSKYGGTLLVRSLQKDAPWVPLDSSEAADVISSFKCPEGVNRYPCFAE